MKTNMNPKLIFAEIEHYLPDGSEDFDGTCDGDFNIEGTDYWFECKISLTVIEGDAEDDYDTGTGYHDVSTHAEIWDTVITESETERVIDIDIIAQVEALIMNRLNS